MGSLTDVNWLVTLPLSTNLPLWNVARQRPQFFALAVAGLLVGDGPEIRLFG